MPDQPTKNSFFLSESLAFFLLGAGRHFAAPYHHIEGISLWPLMVLLIMPALLATLYLIGRRTQKEKIFTFSIFVLCALDVVAAVIAWNDLYRFALSNAAALLQTCILRGVLNILIVYILAKIRLFTAQSPTEKRYGLYCLLSAILIGSQSIFSFNLRPTVVLSGLVLFFVSTSLYKGKT